MAKRNYSILLIDHSQDDAKFLAKILKENGHSVLVARDAQHAVSILEYRGFDALVVDLNVSHIGDMDLISWASCICPKPRIVATGDASVNVEQLAIERGANLFLHRPVDPEKLMRFLAQSKSRSSFSGKVEGVDIIEYVQFVLLGGSKTILEITSSIGTQGRLYIMNGHVIHAECGVLQGEPALYRCLGFREGSFSHLPWAEPEQPTIRKPGEFILMEAVRKRDDAWGDSDAQSDNSLDDF
jgi:two-component system chemotaxis response regulator CheB